MVKLVLVGGVYKPLKLENVGQKFYPLGFEEGPRMAAGRVLHGVATMHYAAIYWNWGGPKFLKVKAQFSLNFVPNFKILVLTG